VADFDDYPFTAFRFDVQLVVADPSSVGMTNPLCQALFAECDGLEMTMEPKTYKEGGNNLQQIHLPGPVSYGQLTLKRGMTKNIDLWKWFTAAAGGTANDNQPSKRGMTAQGLVTMRDGAGTPTLLFELFACLPVKIKGSALSGKDGQVALEELQIAYRSLKIKTP
jgi:phage tail-like protein